MRRVLLLALLLLSLAGCDSLMKSLGPTEHAVKFRRLPPMLSGGIAEKVRQPGETFFVWPWDEVSVFDTRLRNIEWGQVGEGDEPQRSDYVQTRALDGNEVSLAVQIQYSITNESEKLRWLVQNAGRNNEEIDRVVVAVARGDIRTHMNKLRTSEFLNNEAKYRGELEVKAAMRERLERYGIIVRSVNLKEHRFERVGRDGQIDSSYQERINQVEELKQETERARRRREVVIADKGREFNTTQKVVNRSVATADGFKKQAVIRGDSYFQSRSNEAEGIRAQGEAEVEGIRASVDALAGSGGVSLVKLELVRQLLEADPKFIVVEQGDSGAGISVNRLDTNELLKQTGLIEALREKREESGEDGN